MELVIEVVGQVLSVVLCALLSLALVVVVVGLFAPDRADAWMHRLLSRLGESKEDE